ncbi:MAG TPA: hemolysin family protein [Xanthobacteraceae bacterium]|nr:hemolysin family protein [Xanthobacteraceae bacterium]
MSDTDSRRSDAAEAPHESRNLPVPAPPLPGPSGDREGFFARLARALFGWKAGPTRADVEVVLESAVPGETGLSQEERRMLKNILALRERRLDDVMVPRADIVAVQQDISLGELLKTFQSAAHSRLVVYNDTLDDPVGMVHIRDLIAFMMSQAEVPPEKRSKRKKLQAGLDLRTIDLSRPLSTIKIIRDILFVPPSMPAIDLLAKMQASRIHLALVVDEYGGTDGIVSIEDLVEEIVGEIADEHDEEMAPAVVHQPDGTFLADARASLDDVIAAVGPEFDVGEAAREVDTLGGLLMAQAGRLPLRGELVAGPPGFELEVLDADPRRIKKIKIHRSKDRPRAGRNDGRGQRQPAGGPLIQPISPGASVGEDAKSGVDTNSPKQRP